MIYGPDEEFEVGGSRVIRSSDDDDVTIVGTGITVHEALKAADTLAEDGITARVIDAYSIKPIDAETLQAAAEATGRIVTVEDHFPEGGLGDAVLAALAEKDEHPRVLKLAVREMPRSGKPDGALNAYGIDAEHIADCSASARRLRSHHLVEPPLPLAGGAEHGGLVGARLDYLAKRRRQQASRPAARARLRLRRAATPR